MAPWDPLGTTDKHNDENARPIYEHINEVVAHERGINSLGNARDETHVQVHSCLRTTADLRLRSPDWIKSKNPACEAVRRETEEDWGR